MIKPVLAIPAALTLACCDAVGCPRGVAARQIARSYYLSYEAVRRVQRVGSLRPFSPALTFSRASFDEDALSVRPAALLVSGLLSR
jgi:hypothetical protein